MDKQKYSKAETFIESYLEKIDKNKKTLNQAIIDFQKEKNNFEPFGYLFDNEIANIYYYEFDDFEKGKEYFFKALKNCIKDDETKGAIYFYLGNLFTDLKNYTESNQYYKKCINVFAKKTDTDSIFFSEESMINIGQNYQLMGQLDKAKETYLKAHNLYKNTKSSGKALSFISALYHNEFSADNKALELALEAEKLIKSERMQMWNYQLISDIYLAKEDYERAISILKFAIEKFPDHKEISDYYESIGQYYCYWHKEDEGIPFLEEAKNKLDRENSNFDVKYIHIESWIAMAYEGMWNNGKARDICLKLLEDYSFDEHDLIFPLGIAGRVLQKQGNILDGYSVLSKGIKDYEKSRFFNENDDGYIEALETKNELFIKLPIINRLIERLKNR